MNLNQICLVLLTKDESIKSGTAKFTILDQNIQIIKLKTIENIYLIIKYILTS